MPVKPKILYCLLPLLLLCGCSRLYTVELRGRISNYAALNGEDVSFRVEDGVSGHAPDSVWVDSTGRFYLMTRFSNTPPTGLTLLNGDEAIARFEIREANRKFVLRDVMWRTEREVKSSSTMKLEDLQITPTFDLESMRKLNIEKLLDRVTDSDDTLTFHASRPFPTGTRLILTGYNFRDKPPTSIDTTIDLRDTLSVVRKRSLGIARTTSSSFWTAQLVTPYDWTYRFSERSPFVIRLSSKDSLASSSANNH